MCFVSLNADVLFSRVHTNRQRSGCFEIAANLLYNPIKAGLTAGRYSTVHFVDSNNEQLHTQSVGLKSMPSGQTLLKY